jgi:hypothetical protein
MSALKSLASFIVSALFVIFLYLAITSYTMRNLMQKENIESFVQSQLKENVAPTTCGDVCNSQYQQSCEEFCSYLNDTEQSGLCTSSCLNNSKNLEAKQACVQTCLSRTDTSQQYINQTIDKFYSSKIVDDVSLDDAIPMIRNNILFIALSLVFGFLMFFVTEKPVSKIGNAFIWVGIALLSIAAIPVFLTGSEVSVVKIISDYITQSLYQQACIGIILIIVGVILIFIGKKKKR